MGLISTLILDACNAFIGSDSIVRSVRLPLSLHIFRSVYRNVLFFAHNILAFVPVMLYAKIVPTLQWLMVIPGLLIIVIAAVPLSILLGIFCARFRDMQPIVGSIVQLAFFLTPIFWKPSALGHRAYVAHYNPLYMFLELVRGPLYWDDAGRVGLRGCRYHDGDPVRAGDSVVHPFSFPYRVLDLSHGIS